MRSSRGPGRVISSLALTCQLLGCGSQEPPGGDPAQLLPGATQVPPEAEGGDAAAAGEAPPAALIHELASLDRETRLRAVRGLSGSASPQALEALVELLKREPDPAIRKLARAAVTGWQDPRLREHMELALRAHLPRIRAKAAAGLAELGAAESIPALELALESEGDSSVRAALRTALATLEGESENRTR